MKKFCNCLLICLMLSLSLLGLSACGQAKVGVEDIVLTYDSYNMYIGQSSLLRYKLYPENANYYNLSFTSSDVTIANIDREGFIHTTDKYGEVTITITDKYSQISKSCKVTVGDGEIYEIYVELTSVKTTYLKGETFDPTGMVVFGVYDSERIVELSPSEYELTYPKVLTETTTGKVTYKNFSYEFDIFVSDDYVEELVVTTPPTKNDYYIGEIFDPTGMKVSLKYVSGNMEEVADYSVGSEPLEYNTDGVKISYQDFSTFYKPNVRAKHTINDLSKLQSVIDNAIINDSIMLSKGNYSTNSTFSIPKSKNLTIFGENSVNIMTNGKPLFKIIDDEKGENYITKISNFKLTGVENSSIIEFDGVNSTNNLNNFELAIKNITFSINNNGQVVNFTSIENSLFENQLIENTKLTLNNCTIINNENALTPNLSSIYVNGSNNLSLSLHGSNIDIASDAIIIENSSNVNINISNSTIKSALDSIKLNNTQGGTILINDNTTITGITALKFEACENIETMIENSNLSCKSLQGETTSVILFTGCNNITLNASYSNFRVFTIL